MKFSSMSAVALGALTAACAHGGDVVAVAPAAAVTEGVLRYEAVLSGDTDTTRTGSAAIGAATIAVDAAAKTISVQLSVSGLSLGDLSDDLVAGPIGAIHLHNYEPNGDVSLIMPTPYGDSYRDTDDGFTVEIRDYPFADGAALLELTASFADIVGFLDRGSVTVNIHTDAFPNGEISGTLLRAAQ